MISTPTTALSSGDPSGEPHVGFFRVSPNDPHVQTSSCIPRKLRRRAWARSWRSKATPNLRYEEMGLISRVHVLTSPSSCCRRVAILPFVESIDQNARPTRSCHTPASCALTSASASAGQEGILLPATRASCAPRRVSGRE